MDAAGPRAGESADGSLGLVKGQIKQHMIVVQAKCALQVPETPVGCAFQSLSARAN